MTSCPPSASTRSVRDRGRFGRGTRVGSHDLEADNIVLAPGVERRAPGSGKRAHAAEVDGERDLGPHRTIRRQLDAGRYAGACRRRPEGCAQPLLVQQGRVEQICETAELVDRPQEVSPHLLEGRSARSWIISLELLRELQLDCERDELLLDSVVQGPLEIASLRVPGDDQARP